MSRVVAPTVVALAVALVVTLTFARLRYGVDVQDEPMHLASAQRFADGAQPFVDELMASPQNAALLLAPAVGLYERAAGRDGLVLFSRRLYLLFTLAAAAALAWGLRTFVAAPEAVAIAAAAVAFVPFSLPDFHQNTLACTLFSVGCVLGISSVYGGRARARALVSGLAHGLAVFVYPFFLVGALAFAVALWRLRGGRPLAPYVAAAAVPAGALAAVVLWAGLGNVAGALEYGTDYLGQGGGPGKLFETARYRWGAYPQKALVAVAVAALVALHFRRHPSARYLALAVPLLAFAPAALDANVGSVDYVANAGLLGAAVVLPLWREDERARTLFLGVWLPAAVAGLVVSWASSNDGQNFGIGFFPGLLVTAALLVRGVAGRRLRARLAGLASTVALLAVLVGFQYGSVYRDEGVLELDATVRSGPFDGIVTTRAKRDLVLGLERDLRRAGGDDATILVYDELPLGYVLSESVPLTNTAWTLHLPDSPAYRARLLEYYERKDELPDVVVRVRRISLLEGAAVVLRYRPDDPLDRLVRSGRFTLIAERPAYAVFRRRSAD
jgi:hypothetical protein